MNQSLADARVLIVDDEQSMCELIETDLRLRGIQSAWFTSATDAIEAIHQTDYDVVLTDVRMPGTTGLQLCQQLSQTAARYSRHRDDRLRNAGNGDLRHARRCV